MIMSVLTVCAMCAKRWSCATVKKTKRCKTYARTVIQRINLFTWCIARCTVYHTRLVSYLFSATDQREHARVDFNSLEVIFHIQSRCS